jgi:hypothetical protein
MPEFVQPVARSEEDVGDEPGFLVDRDDPAADVLGERVNSGNRKSADRAHGVSLLGYT